MSMVVKVKDKRYSFDTSIKMRCNALNIVCAITILNALDIFDVSKFHEVIKNMQIPGRAEMVLANGRIIVIDNRLTKMLEFLKELKNRGDIKNIKVVLGSMGYGFISWDNKFNTPLFLSKRKEARKYACDLLKKYADYVYFTEDDNAIESVVDICNELQTYLDNQIPSNIILDRKEAIKQAIKDSEIGDVVFISGRGNRKILCNTELTMKLIKDIDVVNEVVKELGW